MRGRGRGAGRARLAWLLAVACVAASPAAAETTIAVVGPASGQGAERTAEIRAAAERAVAALNAAGGVLGETIRVVTDDDGCSASGGDAAARRVVAATPALVLGHPCASAAVSAAKVYGAARLLYVATATRHPALTRRRAGPTIFRLDGRDDRQGAFAAATLAATWPGARFALVSDRTAYARRIVADARAGLVADGRGEPVMLSLVAGEKDYGRLVDDIAASGAAAVLFAGFPIEAAIVLRQMRTRGVAVAFIGTDATATSELVDAAGEAGRAMSLIVPADADPPDVSSAGRLVQAAASPLARRTEGAVVSWAAAVSRAGGFESLRVAAVLSAGVGALAFEPTGDARISSFRLVGPADVSAP